MTRKYRTNTLSPRHLREFAFFGFLAFSAMGCTHETHPGSEMSHKGSHMTGKYSGGHPEMGFHHPDFSSSIRNELSLTAEQKDAFNRIEKEYRRMVIEKQAQIRLGEVDLATLLEAHEIDVAALRKQVDFIGELKKEMMMSRIDSLLELRGVLTQAQYEEFRDILKKRMKDLTHASSH